MCMHYCSVRHKIFCCSFLFYFDLSFFFVWLIALYALKWSRWSDKHLQFMWFFYSKDFDFFNLFFFLLIKWNQMWRRSKVLLVAYLSLKNLFYNIFFFFFFWYAVTTLRVIMAKFSFFALNCRQQTWMHCIFLLLSRSLSERCCYWIWMIVIKLSEDFFRVFFAIFGRNIKVWFNSFTMIAS